MNTVSANLVIVRNEWYNAFYYADTEQLAYLQTEWFLSTNGQKFLTKEIQLKRILENKENIVKLKRSESDLQIREFKNIACVTGRAAIHDGDNITQTNFIENWIKINGKWKIQFISFESE
ncbi:nuclear transport factor 2 family protein [Pseudescherichia sp.]|uniref:nuclear transport factor 2 family protein n=1 Tax=Pseudescherichia sp. TaxID=2055881 RepID=UPI0028A13873|nr:nuclear transport factor 2 family protein [Pseudescherichia sp.]